MKLVNIRKIHLSKAKALCQRTPLILSSLGKCHLHHFLKLLPPRLHSPTLYPTLYVALAHIFRRCGRGHDKLLWLLLRASSLHGQTMPTLLIPLFFAWIESEKVASIGPHDKCGPRTRITIIYNLKWEFPCFFI